MNKGIVIRSLMMVLIANLMAVCAYAALDYPHFGINNIGCDSCHFVYGTQPSLLPEWTAHTPLDIDDTQYNALCWSCHNDIDAPYARTHSSLQTDNGYGDWTVECRVCHNPHSQRQFRAYGSPSYIYSGVSTGVTSTSITMTGAGWTVNAYQGLVVVPNVSQKNYNYKILNNTEETLTVQGPIDLTRVTVGNVFAVAYGKLIKDFIELDDIINPIRPKTGNKTTRFFNATGPNSFADGDVAYDGVCEVCHTQTTHYRNDGNGPDQLHTNMGTPSGTNCTNCHKHANGFRGMGGGAHPTHVIDDNGPQVGCYDCHQTGNIPFFKSGTDSNGDGKYELSETDVCNNCHSSNGVSTARTYWIDDPGTWPSTDGEASFCGSCHDETPGNSVGDGSGDPAPNIVGDSSTYGFYVTGHGKTSGNYARLSWQATIETGNQAANKQCSSCHDLTTAHFNNSTDRLKTGYQNDANNSNCKQCHDPGTVAVGNPQWYTTYAAYQNSAHKNKKCSDCHNVHGASGATISMTKLNQESLCNQVGCHSGIGGHPGVGSTAFTRAGKDYTLECVSCHNVHIVTGRYAQADQDKSPVTRFSNNTDVWGDDLDEKMDFYAGGGTYRTQIGESFTGAQLPDYPSFCLDCHGTGPINHDHPEPSPYFGITWSGDPHGQVSANQPNGYGTCPNWFACGKAFGWDGDDCKDAQGEFAGDCWPVVPRGAGDELFSRDPYTHTERIAGANFTLSCTDCHTGHGTGTLTKPTVNGSPFQGQSWNVQCNACHYYYSDWHAGMACGNASCHTTNSIHRAQHWSGSGGTRTFNPGLVIDMRFENNLKDSGTWQMDGKWMDDLAGSFTSGKSGQAVVLEGGKNIQIGTENGYWSTDEGYHGTWKYTDMKFNTTLEAWIYPTDNAASEYLIFSKHTGYSDGGYQFALRNINNSLRAVFNMMADNNGTSQGGKTGGRGAYSSVVIPLNTWTHVAATFDTSGTDKNPGDPSAGRIRIYVNGEDVTTSKSSGADSQPGTGETSIYAYSENSPWNQSICYDGSWCASEFSIGGFYAWQNEFIGRIDEAKVWNITKDAGYFASYDAMGSPYISAVEGVIGSNQLTVTFSEGVFTDMGPSGSLIPGDFVFADADNARTINSVTHTAGSPSAILTLSAPLDDTNDVNVDTMSAAGNSIFDNYNKASGTNSITVTTTSSCPVGTVTFNLNEVSGSEYVLDTQGILSGKVTGGTAALNGSAYSGDGSSRYIDFENNDACLQATTTMTIEAYLKPTGISADGSSYIRRVLARDGGGNYQMSVWRNNSATDQDPPNDVVMVALWVKPENAHGGNAWKVILTDFNTCPIVNDKWYQIKAVWNSSVIGGIPASIYVDDQGANGDNEGESWSGYINCTDTDQSQIPTASEVFEGDVISPSDGDFLIGANVSTHTNNVFWGLIDWITWKDAVD